ncbi:MAG: ABC transporter permease [Schleiferiaceae bacterium]|nr:ABC transporter permease [Schleiferiaceae bacterium]
MKTSLFRENIRIAVRAIRAQLTRAIITALIISFGIMALVGILTAIDAIQQSITGEFSALGATTFSVSNKERSIFIGRRGTRPKPNPAITYEEAKTFKERFTYGGSIVSISYMASGMAEAKYKSKKTNPNTQVWAIDENFLVTNGLEIDRGRAFTKFDNEQARPVAIIGPEIKDLLYEDEDPLGKAITLRGRRFKIVGVMKSKGSSNIFSGDRSVYITVNNARGSYASPNRTYNLNVMASSGEKLEATIGEAKGVMRAVRKLAPKEKSNFAITRSDNLASILIELMSSVTYAAMFIGIITLFSASISLMNMMLVSVTERTKEIGTRKAIGAKSSNILIQFLTEAVIITQVGGLFGAVIGIAIGNIVAYTIGGAFFIPWNWIILAFILCFVVGVVAGIYPASKAAKQDPIDALRYE